MKRDGRWIVSERKEPWKGLLLSGPNDGAVWGRIADLEQASATVQQRYRHAVQSMMLVDDQRRLRVRESDRTACRTVVAEDIRGRLMVLLTFGAVTLADLARWLTTQDLGIVRAMNLDGGIESQLAIRTDEFEHAYYGQYGTETTVFEGAPGTIRFPLPAVIAVRPVTAAKSGPLVH
ncbi:MAG: phosphodiester glycosidase family protein [Myxococcota bacterium]